MKITRINIYEPQKRNEHFNQSDMLVCIETDEGITGIGEGGARDTLEQCAAMLIGQDPGRINHLWQVMYRGWFYPAGREKLHALGALDLALWDIQGKRLGVPVHTLLGGLSRDFVECYATGFPWQGDLGATARACVEAGFRAFRTSVSDPAGGDGVFHARQVVDQTASACQTIAEAVRGRGEWSIDFHTRLDLADAVRLSTLIEPLNPLFVEDPLRSENPGALAAFRAQSKVPVAVGEQFGDRWDIHELIERHVIDYTRVTLPNVGGITEFLKIAALCETHYVGMVPHFTGPVALAALVHVLGSAAVPVFTEVAGGAVRLPPHLSAAADFHDGRLWPNTRPGLGVVFEPSGARLVSQVSEYHAPIPMFRRPDGSFTNW